MIKRRWSLKVTHKREGMGEWYELTLSNSSLEHDMKRPFWSDRTTMGVPASITVDANEYHSIAIGDIVEISLLQVTST